MASPAPQSEVGSEASSMPPPPQASTSAIPAPPASDASTSAAAKPKRKRSTKEKVPGPGKNWRKGLKGALGKKPLEYDAEGNPVVPQEGISGMGDVSGSVTAAPSPGGAGTPAAGSSSKPKAKKQKTQGQSPAPEAVTSKDAQQSKGSTKMPLFAKTPRTRHWSKTQRSFTNISGYSCSLPVLAGDENSPFAKAQVKSSSRPQSLGPTTAA